MGALVAASPYGRLTIVRNPVASPPLITAGSGAEPEVSRRGKTSVEEHADRGTGRRARRSDRHRSRIDELRQTPIPDHMGYRHCPESVARKKGGQVLDPLRTVVGKEHMDENRGCDPVFLCPVTYQALQKITPRRPEPKRLKTHYHRRVSLVSHS